MSRARRVLVIGLATVALLLIALAAAAVLIPGDRVAAAVATRAEALLGQPVRIGDVGLRLLPLPGVRLSDVVVGGHGGEDTLAAAGTVELRVRLLPLLRGDVVIHGLALDRPRLRLEIDSAGRSNLPVLRGESTAAGVAGGRTGRAVGFALHRFAVSDGQLAFRDRRDGSVVHAAGWDQRLRIRGAARGGRLARIALAGWLEVEDLDATLPEVVLPLRDAAFRATHRATYDHAADRLELRTLDVLVGGVTLEGAGSVDSVSSRAARTADLTLQADGFDAQRLTGLLSDSLRSRLGGRRGRSLHLTGVASLRAGVVGPLRADSMPAIDGHLGVTDLRLTAGEAPLAEQVRVEVVFSADSVQARVGGALLGERFSLAVTIRDPASPTAFVAFTGRTDLARLDDVGLVPDTLAPSGTVRGLVRGVLPLRDLAATRLAGTITLAGIRPGGAEPAFTVPSGTITLDGPVIRLDPAAVRVGADGALAVRAELDGWIPFLVDSAAALPFVAAEVSADTLDLDRLFGPPEGAYSELLFARLQDRPLMDGRTAAEAAEAAGMRIPALPQVDAEVRFRADRVVRNVLAYEAIDATLRLRPEGAELLAATFRLMDGTVRAAGALTPTGRDSTGAPDQARLTGTYALTGVRAAPFFNRLTPFRDHLAGDMSLAGSLALDLDYHVLPERATTRARGSIAISNGRVASWRVLAEAAQRLGLETLDTLRFRDWAGTFEVAGPLVVLEETGLDGRELGVRAAGSFDFSGPLDVGATVYLTRALAARGGPIGEEILATGRGDRIPVGLRITGSARAPDVRLDLSETRGNVVARAREAAGDQAREVADRAARAVLDRFEVPEPLRRLPPDSLRALYADSLRLPPDSLRAGARNALRKRLRSLFGGG